MKVVKSNNLPVPISLIERRIFLIRGHKVMLDSDLSELYQVETKNLNKAVKRNIKRFPEDFMFQLSEDEMKILIFQFGISRSGDWGGRRHLPYAFTEQEVAMLSGILNSERAIQVNIAIMRAFVKLRAALESSQMLNRKLKIIEAKVIGHDIQIKAIFVKMKQLTGQPKRKRKKIGFRTE